MDFGVSVKYASIRHKLLRYAVRWTMKWWLLASGYKLENNGLLCGNSSSCLELQRSCLQNDNSTIVIMCTMPYDQWLCTSRRKAYITLMETWYSAACLSMTSSKYTSTMPVCHITSLFPGLKMNQCCQKEWVDCIKEFLCCINKHNQELSYHSSAYQSRQLSTQLLVTTPMIESVVRK